MLGQILWFDGKFFMFRDKHEISVDFFVAKLMFCKFRKRISGFVRVFFGHSVAVVKNCRNVGFRIIRKNVKVVAVFGESLVHGRDKIVNIRDLLGRKVQGRFRQGCILVFALLDKKIEKISRLYMSLFVFEQKFQPEEFVIEVVEVCEINNFVELGSLVENPDAVF